MNVFGDSDFFIQKGTYFPYIYLPFLKPTQTGFIEKRPFFQVFGILRQLQKIPDAQFQSGYHLSGATLECFAVCWGFKLCLAIIYKLKVGERGENFEI